MAGGALGTGARVFVSGWVAHRVGEAFPWGTVIVNASGCFLIGLFSGLTDPEGRWTVGPTGRQFFTLGMMGGYTTFSSFSLQTLRLARDGEWLWASGNVGGSVALCLAGVWLGYAAALAINPGRAH